MVAGSPDSFTILNRSRQAPVLSWAGLNRENCFPWAPERIPGHFCGGRPVCSPCILVFLKTHLGETEDCLKGTQSFHLFSPFSFIEIEMTHNIVNLRYVMCCFDTHVYCEMTTIMLVNTSITSHNNFCMCVCVYVVSTVNSLTTFKYLIQYH